MPVKCFFSPFPCVLYRHPHGKGGEEPEMKRDKGGGGEGIKGLFYPHETWTDAPWIGSCFHL